MKPSTEALQVFYGTIPLIVIILGVWFLEKMLLTDILFRLGDLNRRLDEINKRIDDNYKELSKTIRTFIYY